MKYAPDGTLLWQKTWGGDRYSGGRAIALAGTVVYVTGFVQNSYGKEALLLLKYDTDGNYLDLKSLSATYQQMDGFAISLDDTGNIFITGRTTDTATGYDDLLIVKYSSSMVFQWQRQWGNDNDDVGYAVCHDAGGDIYVAGRAWGGGLGGYDVVLMKVSSSGSAVWKKIWGGDTHDETFGMAIDGVGNLYLIGGTYGFGTGMYEGLLLKFNSCGLCLWARTWGIGTADDRLRAITLGSDNILTIAGWDPQANGIWGDASAGVTQATSVDLVDAAGTDYVPTGADSTPVGTLGTPSGIQDTGGGGDDILVIQGIRGRG